MTDGQTRVLVLLLVLFGLDISFNPTLKNNILHGNLSGFTPAYIGLGVGGVALVALAAPAPKAATYIVLAFIVLALIEHSGAWASMLGNATASLQQLTGSQAQAAPKK